MQQPAQATTNRFTAEGEAQTIADRITKDIRAAVTASSTGPRSPRRRERRDFYANLADPNGPTKLHALPDPASRHERLPVPRGRDGSPTRAGAPGNYTYAGTASTRIDGQYLDTTQPIFSYFDARRLNPIPTPITRSRPCAASTSSASTSGPGASPTAPIVVIQTPCTSATSTTTPTPEPDEPQ